MPDNFDEPRRYDVVKGGQNSPPIAGVVLGGLEGVKQRMANASAEIQIAQLKEALKYGKDGLDVAIAALDRPDETVQWAAYLLLKTRTEETVREALQNYLPIIYQKLRKFLAAGKWKEGDRQTAAILLKIARREQESWLRVEDINALPSDELQIVDRLWREASHERFGFSIQKQIWQKVGTNYWAFGDKVGWRHRGAWLNYESLNFTATAPEGHLPAAHLTWGSLQRGQQWLWYGGTPDDVRWFEVKSLLSRREKGDRSHSSQTSG